MHQQCRITLQDIEVYADIGIHDFELIAKQRLLISAELELATTKADYLAIDEMEFRKQIETLVANQRFKLQETLCEALLNLCFANPSVVKAAVQSCKPDVYPDCAAVCCRVAAHRSDTII